MFPPSSAVVSPAGSAASNRSLCRTPFPPRPSSPTSSGFTAPEANVSGAPRARRGGGAHPVLNAYFRPAHRLIAASPGGGRRTTRWFKGFAGRCPAGVLAGWHGVDDAGRRPRAASVRWRSQANIGGLSRLPPGHGVAGGADWGTENDSRSTVGGISIAGNSIPPGPAVLEATPRRHAGRQPAASGLGTPRALANAAWKGRRAGGLSAGCNPGWKRSTQPLTAQRPLHQGGGCRNEAVRLL